MTDKEFKRLSRAQLIDIIYQFQLKQDELIAENEKLAKELADRRIRVKKAGNIAEAALEIQNLMQSAQEAANLYLEEIRTLREETETECERMLEEAQKEADYLIALAKLGKTPQESAVDAIMKEFRPRKKASGERR